jgi:hypothetical protein
MYLLCVGSMPILTWRRSPTQLVVMLLPPFISQNFVTLLVSCFM